MCRRSVFTAILGALVSLLGVPRGARAAAYHRGHDCPRCGNVVFRVYASGPGRYHTHRCGNTYWYH
jgi:ribosomal protein S27AE